MLIRVGPNNSHGRFSLNASHRNTMMWDIIIVRKGIEACDSKKVRERIAAWDRITV